jgi:hypothetical protein
MIERDLKQMAGSANLPALPASVIAL